MRLRLFKAISCVALMLSVFFCISFPVLADETVSSEEELVGFIDSYANVQTFNLAPLADLEEDDYTGAALFQVLSQRASMYFQYQGFTFKDQGYSKAEGNYMGAYKLPVYLTIGFQVERGHTYSGAVSLTGNTVASLDENFKDNVDSNQTYIGSFVFSGYDEVSPESVDVSVYPVIVAGSDADYTININFNNYQSTFDGYVYVNVTLHFDLATIIYSSKNPWWVQRSVAVVNTHASDWAGTLKDYPTNAIVDSDGSLIYNQTVQQQQIADQQAQQSEQQHNSLINGYDNAANDNMLSDKNSVLKGFEQQQDQAMSNGQQYVADFSANYDTAPLQAMAPAFMMISTWFNDLWGGMGNFSTVLIVGLMLCVAGYILKLKH